LSHYSLVSFSHKIARHSAHQIRMVISPRVQPTTGADRDQLRGMMLRYLKYRGLFLERVHAWSQVSAHKKPPFAEHAGWVLTVKEIDRVFDLLNMAPDRFLRWMLESWAERGQLIPTNLQTTEDLEAFLIGFSEYCDAISSRAAWEEHSEMLAFELITPFESWLNERFGNLADLPEDRFAPAAKYHCRKFVLSEKLYPWRHTRNERSIEQAYPFAMMQSGFSPIEGRRREELIMEFDWRSLDLDQESLNRIRSVLDQLQSRMSDWDWDEFVGEFTKDGFQSGPGSMIGAPDFNVIPGEMKSACQPYVVAMASGLGRSRISLGNTLKALTEHLLRCEKTEVAIVVTDVIDAKSMSNWITSLEIHQNKKGVKFLMLLARGRRLNQIPFF
jgi:hypothetical protein